MRALVVVVSTVVITIPVVVGCMKSNTPTNRSEVFGAERSATDVIAGSLRYHPTASIDRTKLAIVLAQDEQCKAVEPEDATLYRRVTCREHKVANWTVSLHVPGVDWRLNGSTDLEGRVLFPLTDVPEVAFHDGTASFEVVLGAVTIPVEGVDDGHLLNELAADPTSRVSRDRESSAKTSCDAAVAAARAAQREETSKADEAVGAWKTAKSACGHYWNDDWERESGQAGIAARDAHLAEDTREFDAAIAAVIANGEVSTDKLNHAEQLLNALGQLEPPDPLLEKRTKQLQATRGRALDAVLAGARSRLARDDLDGASSALAVARSISRDDPRTERLAKQIEARQKAKLQEEERRRDRTEGPPWNVYWKCYGNVNIVTLAERSDDQGSAIRAPSASGALKTFCKEGCSGYETVSNDPRLSECARNCMAMIGPAPDSAVDRCMRVTVERAK
jgi:hypothetical protein